MDQSAFLKEIQNKEILPDSAYFREIHQLKAGNEQLVMEMNSSYHSNQKVLDYLSEISGATIDPSVTISLPFYTDFGKHIRFGKEIFINQNVTFVDLGGIVIEDNVLIGPMSRLITVNHLADPVTRRGLFLSPIHIKKNAWLGANVTILPGVTVGENAIIAADSTVTKDVPANVIVAGSPAKIIKSIKSKGCYFNERN